MRRYANIQKAREILIKELYQRGNTEDAQRLELAKERLASKLFLDDMICGEPEENWGKTEDWFNTPEEDEQENQENCKKLAAVPTLKTKDAKALQPSFPFPVVGLLRQPLTLNSLQFFGTLMVPPEIAYEFSVDHMANREPLEGVKKIAKDWPWEMQMALTSDYSRNWIAKACKGCPDEDIGAVLTNAVKMMCLAPYLLEFSSVEAGYKPRYRKDLKFDSSDTRAAFAKACEGGLSPGSWDAKDFLIQ